MELPSRHSQRKPGHDYSQPGVYFITICTQNMTHLFGEVVDGEMRPNEAGRMVDEIWRNLPTYFPTIEMDEFIIMPNHLHGIIILNQNVRAGLRARPPKSKAETEIPPELKPDKPTSIIDVIHSFKSFTTHTYTHGVTTNNWEPFRWRLWKRNFHDSIVTHITALEDIRNYIRNNPKEWKNDPAFIS